MKNIKHIKYLAAILLVISICFTAAISAVYGDDVLPADEFEVDLTFEASTAIDENMVLNAQSAIAIEAQTGRVLFEKNAHTKRAMASTTKIVTALIAIEYGKLDEVVTVSKNAAYTPGSTIKLKVNEELKLLDLIYGLMLKSGNDAAVAIAEHVAGSEEAFAEKMNQKAAELGAVNTHFVTVHGLDDENHYSTASDMAVIAAACMKNETFRKVVSTAETYISNRSLRNTNDLLFTYEGATGVKTGFTNGAGRCLVASAKRNGMEVITVVLGCDNKTTRFSDSRKLLDYTFKTYSMQTLLQEDQVVTKIKVIKGQEKEVKLLCTDTIVLPMKESEKQGYSMEISVDEEIKAPCAKGKVIGTVYIISQGETIATTELKIAEEVERKGLFDFFQAIFRCWKDMI